MKKVGNKVVVVGLGAVGVSYAYSMLNQALCDDMVLSCVFVRARRRLPAKPVWT